MPRGAYDAAAPEGRSPPPSPSNFRCGDPDLDAPRRGSGGTEPALPSPGPRKSGVGAKARILECRRAAWHKPPTAGRGRVLHEDHHLRGRAGRLADRPSPGGRAERCHGRRQQRGTDPPGDRYARCPGHRRACLLPGRARPGGGAGCRDDHRRDLFRRGQHGHLPSGPFRLRRAAQDRAAARAKLSRRYLLRSVPPRPHADRRGDLAREGGGRGRPAAPLRTRRLRHADLS